MSQAFLAKSNCKGINLEPIASVGHDAVLTRGRRSTKEGGALLTKERKVRVYDKEFKLNAIQLYLTSGRNYLQVSREIGIPVGTW